MTSDINPVSGVNSTSVGSAETPIEKNPSASDVSAFDEALNQSNSEPTKEEFDKAFSDWMFTQMQNSMKEAEKQLKESIAKQKEELES